MISIFLNWFLSGTICLIKMSYRYKLLQLKAQFIKLLLQSRNKKKRTELYTTKVSLCFLKYLDCDMYTTTGVALSICPGSHLE